jgi:hypothetical protein
MPTLLHWVAFWGGAPGEPAVPIPAVFDDWLHPITDTTGTYSTDTDPDRGEDPPALSTAINPE